MQAGDIITAEIVDMTAEGKGIVKEGGAVIFTDSGVVGDFVSIKITDIKKNFLEAEVFEIIQPSKSRRESDCSAFGECGGCDFRNLIYEEQLILKKKIVENAIRRIGGFSDIVIEDTIGADNLLYYRNNVQLPVRMVDGEIKIGFFKKKTNEIVEFDKCKIIPEKVNLLIPVIKKFIIDSKISVSDGKNGNLKHIGIRISPKDEIMLIFVVKERYFDIFTEDIHIIQELKHSGVVSIYENVNPSYKFTFGNRYIHLCGEECLNEKIFNYDFKLSPASFFQVNREQTEKLYSKAIEYADLSSNDIVFDLYSGVGSISIAVAEKASKVVGIESVNDAVKNARNNAKINGIKNIEFKHGKVEEVIQETLQEHCPTKIILDPPRKGADKNAIEAIGGVGAERIVYVSCNPATLARDLKIIREYGYELKKVQPVDMFVFTGNVECVALMQKCKK